MLDYVALGLLFFVAITLFYGIIAIHDIPYEISKHRNHPQQDAIHVAGWVSLFTLHVLWPFLWIWATLYREDRGWGFQSSNSQQSNSQQAASGEKNSTHLLEKQLSDLQTRFDEMEKTLVKINSNVSNNVVSNSTVSKNNASDKQFAAGDK